MFKTATIESISHGTLRAEDLIDAFTSELEWQIARNGEYFALNTEDRDRLADLVGRAIDATDDPEIVDDLMDALNEFAPDHCYFGSHPGDGSDFGYWPDPDFLFSPESHDVPRISDPCQLNDLPIQSGEALHVNDHGNATLYAWNGEAWHEVWAIV